MKILFIFLLVLATPFKVCAEDKIFLYGDYYYGMSREDFFKTGPAQCDDYPDGKTICNRQKVVFAAVEWTQFFEFDKNGLTCVAFGHPISMTAISAAMAWLQDEDFAPINAEAGKSNISFSLLYDRNTKNQFKKEYKNFSRDLPDADRFNACLIKSSTLHEYKTMDKLPDDALVVSLGGSKRQDAIFVCFELAKSMALEHSR